MELSQLKVESLDAIEKDYTYESYQIKVSELLRGINKGSSTVSC